MVTSLGREGYGEREAKKMVERWQEVSSQQEFLCLSLANVFLRHGHLIGLISVPTWCYTLLNHELSLKICHTQCVYGT